EVAAALAPFVGPPSGRPGEPSRAPAGAARLAAPPWSVALALLLLGAGLIALVTYRIATAQGEVVIETEDDAVEVVVKQGGKVVTSLDARSNQKMTLDTGEYTVSLADGADGLKIDMPNPFTLRRGEKKVVTVRRLPAGEVRRFAASWVLGVAFSPDDRYALSAGVEFAARLWDVKTGEEIGRLEGHQKPPVAVAFSPDGKQALTGSWDGTMRLWDVASRKELRQFEHKNGVETLMFSADGKRALAGSHSSE